MQDHFLDKIDVSLQVGPNGYYFFERQPSVYDEYKSEKAEESFGTKHRSEDGIRTLDKNIYESEFLIKDVSIQTTTGEVSSYGVSPSVEQIQKLFAKKIFPYYLLVEKKARQKVLKIIYDITPPPVLRSLKTQTSESDFDSEIIPNKAMKLKFTSVLEMKAKSSQFRVPKETSSEKSAMQQSISKQIFFKEIAVSHKNVSIQVDLDDYYYPEMADKRRRIKTTTEDTEGDSSKIKMAKHELGESVTDTYLKTKVLEDLKRFLLEKDVWDVVFSKRRASKGEKEFSKGKPILVSECHGKYPEEDRYPTAHWVDSFIAELVKTSSKVIQDILMHFSEQIKLRDVAMNLYWQAMNPKNYQKHLQGFDKNFINSELEAILEEKEPIIKSSDIDEKLLSHEKMGKVGQYVDDIKKLMKRIDSIPKSSESNIDNKNLSKRLLNAILIFQEELHENVSKMVKHSNIKYLTADNLNKAEELLDHDRTIYKYSEINEVIPHLWIGDYSVFKTPRKLRKIQYRVILGDCKNCITDQHDICIAKVRPFIYIPPFYRVIGNIHSMGIQAVDDATFPIFEYFRSASDYIEKCLSDSNETNVVVISESGKSRCAAIVMAYLMIKKDYTLREAVQELKRKRAIRPNLGFMIQLIKLEQNLRKTAGQKRPYIRMKNVFPIRRKPMLDSFWLREEQTVLKPTKSFIFSDDRMSRPDRRLGVNTNLFLHSPFSAPGPHFYKDIESSTVRTSMFEMLPFYELDIASTRCDYKYPVVEGRVLASFSC